MRYLCAVLGAENLNRRIRSFRHTGSRSKDSRMAYVRTASPPARQRALALSSVAAGGLLGREKQLSRVAEALKASRLGTLTAAPRSGKNRFSLAVAHDHPDVP